MVNGSHRYLRVHSKCYCAEQSLLARLLRAPGPFFKHVGLRNSLHLLMVQRWSRGYSRLQTLDLPVHGDVCVPVQRGYLVFNFANGTVVHLFEPHLDAVRFQAYEAVFKKVSRLSFTPKLRRVSAREQWLETDYIAGRHGQTLLALSASEFLDTFRLRVLPCLVELASSEAQRVTAFDEHLCALLPALADQSCPISPDLRRQLDTFLERTCESLPNTAELMLGYTHGDFVHPNLIDSKAGLRVIDWDTAGWRSLLHDLHAYYFSQIYWRGVIDLPPATLEQAIREFVTALPASHSVVFAPEILHAYRRIYYLERLAMVMGRTSDRGRERHLHRSVSLYEQFEKLQPK